MGDDSSFIDGFSEAAFYTHDVEVPTNAAKKDCSSSFEILPLDSIIMDLFQKVEQAQTFLAVSLRLFDHLQRSSCAQHCCKCYRTL